MFVLTLFLIAATAGESCASATEAACSGGCIWTNYTGVCAGGACGGSPTCAGLTGPSGTGSCGGTNGCTWVPQSFASCDGAATCTGQTDPDTCALLGGGCSWTTTSNATCAGAPTTCSGDNETNCALTGCTYTNITEPAACTGDSPIYCNNVFSPASCGVVNYCEWEDPTPAQCYIEIEENTPCDVFNDVEEYGSLGPVYCSLYPGCTYSGSVGTCSGIITKTCSQLSIDDCGPAQCDSEPEGECKASYSCYYYDSNEEQCNATAGCTYDNDTETCTGTPTSCSVYNNKKDECDSQANCYFDYAVECSLPWKCSDLYETGCEAAGCDWDAENYECTGTANVTAATCSASGSSFFECSNAGCYARDKYFCTGSVKLASCAAWGYGGQTCTNLGCTSSGDTPGTCSGTVNVYAGAGAATEAACKDLGPIFQWYDGDEGGCGSSGHPTYKQCSEFTSNGKETCYGLGCTWKEEVPVGCAGTPTNAGNECASFSDEDQCKGNQCTWVLAGGSLCTGTTTEACSNKSASAENCANISGCTYTAAVATPYCTGTPQGFCVGGISTSCENVKGCTWTGCSSWNSQTDCVTNLGCTWNQPGVCNPAAADSGAASFVCAPALLVLLLLLTLML